MMVTDAAVAVIIEGKMQTLVLNMERMLMTKNVGEKKGEELLREQDSLHLRPSMTMKAVEMKLGKSVR